MQQKDKGNIWYKHTKTKGKLETDRETSETNITSINS